MDVYAGESFSQRIKLFFEFNGQKDEKKENKNK
ncbi:hypothetical protein [Bacteroides pyogenes]